MAFWKRLISLSIVVTIFNDFYPISVKQILLLLLSWLSHFGKTYVDFIIIIYIYPFSDKKRTHIFPDLGWHQCIVEILSVRFRTGVLIVIFIFVKKDLYQFNYFLFHLFYVGAPPCLVSF